MKVIYFLLIYAIAQNAVLAVSNYKGLSPISSSCSDAAKVFKNEVCGQKQSKHIVDGDNIIITYSKTRCETAWGKKWNVKSGVILSIERQLKKSIPIIDLQVNLLDLEKGDISSDINEIIYWDRKNGIAYFTSSNLVSTIYYFPSEKMNKYQCNETIKTCVINDPF
jgi:hypothetical protein